MSSRRGQRGLARRFRVQVEDATEEDVREAKEGFKHVSFDRAPSLPPMVPNVDNRTPPRSSGRAQSEKLGGRPRVHLRSQGASICSSWVRAAGFRSMNFATLELPARSGPKARVRAGQREIIDSLRDLFRPYPVA